MRTGIPSRPLSTLLALVVPAVLVALAAAAPIAPASAAIENTRDQATAGAPLYRIGVGDRLDVFVYEDNQTREVVVRPDGRITIPLAGDLQAEGVTPPELAANIRKALEPYQKNPTVTVSVREIHSYRIYVLGNVRQPNMIESASPMRVLQALATAGGLNEYANKNIVVIREKRGGAPQRIPVNYSRIIKGDALDLNIWLEAGDVVVAE